MFIMKKLGLPDDNMWVIKAELIKSSVCQNFIEIQNGRVTVLDLNGNNKL